MTRIRLAWILPLVQVALAEASWQLDVHRILHPRVRGDIYWRSTFDLFCAGLNSPADYMYQILNNLLGSSGGTVSGNLMYMSLVAILWYLVGRKVDMYRFSGVGGQEKMSTGRLLTNLLAGLYGMGLFLMICYHNMIFTNPRSGSMQTSNFIGDILHQSLWLLWSLLLILVPSITLASAFRRRQVAHP